MFIYFFFIYDIHNNLRRKNSILIEQHTYHIIKQNKIENNAHTCYAKTFLLMLWQMIPFYVLLNILLKKNYRLVDSEKKTKNLIFFSLFYVDAYNFYIFFY